MLTCIELTGEYGTGGSPVWRCRCDCGRECLVTSAQLSRGDRKSCGCLRHPKPKDMTGRRFGSLTVTEYAGRRGRNHYWKCQCDCGCQAEVSQNNLVSGHTKSCGCLQRQSPANNMRLVDGTSVAMIEKRMVSPIASNKSGYNGVYRERRTGRWAAQITFKGKTYYLGSYTDIQDAVKARKRGEEVYDDFLEWYYGQQKDTAAV